MNLHAVNLAEEPIEAARVLLVDDNEMTLTVTAATPTAGRIWTPAPTASI